GGGSSGSSLSKGDIQSAIEGASPKIASDIHDKLTEKDTSSDDIPQQILEERVRAAFAFPAPVAQVESDVGCLELFHGPTLAFKD
ncbi:hypothetical protein MJN69_30150, partial [Salmonella enterica subsp. enterica serovar Kentucky]|nr:hypothetical protein [Salmonella enterica subsp. enterica serovar Kentucky]